MSRPAALVAAGGLSVPTLARWERGVLVASALGVSGLAWGVLMGGGGGAGPGGFAAAAAMWLLMMVAMMLPATLPWLFVMGALSKGPAPGSARGVLPAGAVGLFGAAYFAVWLAFALVGAALQLWLRGAGLLGADLAMASPLGAVIVVAAGLYQVTPAKSSCLRHCRNPMGFFLSRWRNGPLGALRMGLSHGVFCVGCCWALMLLGFALGVMNLAFMAVLTVVVCVENLAPGGPAAGRALGVGLVALGLVLLLAG